MLISCKQCSTTYSLDDYLVVPEGVVVQCTRCGHVFMAMPPEGKVVVDEEEAYPALNSTQIFGTIPEPAIETPSPSTSPFSSSVAAGFEYGRAKESAQAAQITPASLHESGPHEVAYFDFESNHLKEDPLSSNFMRETQKLSPSEFPATNANAFLASRRALASAPSPIAELGLIEPADEPTLIESNIESKKESCTADLPAVIVDEIRRVEDEQAAQLQRLHESADFLAPKRKNRWGATLFVVLVVVVLTVFAGSWLILDYSPEQLWLKIQNHVLSLKF